MFWLLQVAAVVVVDEVAAVAQVVWSDSHRNHFLQIKQLLSVQVVQVAMRYHPLQYFRQKAQIRNLDQPLRR
jgi:hypothetical protein